MRNTVGIIASAGSYGPPPEPESMDGVWFDAGDTSSIVTRQSGADAYTLTCPWDV